MQQVETTIQSHYLILDQIGNLGEGRGYLRAGYSPEETQVIKYFENLLANLGFVCKYDALGNFSAALAGESGKYIELASHVDTVPNGGNFDGIAGVLTGFEAINNYLNENKSAKHKHGLRLRIWRLEEAGTYNAVYTGSLSAFGQLDPKTLENKFKGQSLYDAIATAGYEPELIKSQKGTINQEEIDSILAHFELHIEQGTVLEKQNKKVGIVTSIRGNNRYLLSLKGRYDHSGTTPMGTEYRKDCNLALAYMLTELDQFRKQYQEIVQTVGVINSDPDRANEFQTAQNGITKVSGSAFFTLDIRSSVSAELESYKSKAIRLLEEQARQFNVEITIKDLGLSKPMESLDKNLGQCLEKICIEKNIPHTFMPSGAGHDSLVVARQIQSSGKQVPVAMLFIPCKNGVSHDPLEFASFEDLAIGTKVLQSAIEKLQYE